MRSQPRRRRWHDRLVLRARPALALAIALALAACDAPDARPPMATAAAEAADLADDAASLAGDAADVARDAVEAAGDVAGAAGDAAANAARGLNAAATAAAGAERAASTSAVVVGNAMALAGRVMQEGLAALEAPLAAWRPALDQGLDRLAAAADELAEDAERVDDAAWRAEVEAALAMLRGAAGEMAVAGQAVAGRAEDSPVGEQLGAAGARLAGLVADIERSLASGDVDGMRAVIGAASAARDVLGAALDALENALP